MTDKDRGFIDEIRLSKTETESITTEGKTEPTYRDVFKNRNFVKLLTGQFFSNFGDAIFRIAIQMYVYSFAFSAKDSTLILAAQTAPWIIIGPIAGVFADRISRKALMVSADAIRGTAILILPFIRNIYGIAVIAFILGAASAAFVAPRSAAIPEITGMRLYVKAISLSQLVFQTLAVIGPIFAAPVYVLLGPSTFWITSGCFFVSGIIIFFTNIPSASREKSGKIGLGVVLKDLRSGFTYLVKQPTVRLIIFLFTFIIIGTAFAGPLLLPYVFEITNNAIAIQYFNLPTSVIQKHSTTFTANLYTIAKSQFGYLGAIAAFGSIVGNLVFGKYEKQIGRSKALVYGSLAISLYYFVFSFNPSFYILLIVGLTQGFLNGMFSLSINALFAENVPNKVRGRAYSATNAYIQVFSVICLSLSGLTADSVGVLITVTGAGIFLLITTIIIMLSTRFYKFADQPPNPTLIPTN